MKSLKVILPVVTILVAIVFLPLSCINGTLDKDQEEISGGDSEEEPSKDDNFYEDYVKPYTPEIKAIDLGLSVKRGDRNLGSESIEDYGGLYYMFGVILQEQDCLLTRMGLRLLTLADQSMTSQQKL